MMLEESFQGNSSDFAIAAHQSDKERKYWLNKLTGNVIKSTFPYDFPKTLKNQQEPKIDSVDIVFPRELVSRLIWISNKSDIRLLTILTAALVLLLSKYTGNDDIMIGMPIYKQDIEGAFINTVVVLSNRLWDSMTFKELLYQVKQTSEEAIRNQNYPIKTLLYELGLPYTPGDFPLFDIAIMVENIQDKKYIQHIHTNMNFSFLRESEGLGGTVEFNSSFYHQDTICRIATHFVHLLNKAIANIDETLSQIDWLPETERKKLLEDFNDTRQEYGDWMDKTIHQLFRDQVEKTPGNIALVLEKKKLTYLEFNEKANRLARVLREKGVANGSITALLMESSIEMVVSVMAVLKAGGAYLPIDREIPVERKKYILKDSGIKLLLMDDNMDPIFITRPGHLETVNTCSEDIYSDIKDGSNSGLANRPTELAYVIYTSGTTGKPKGVMVEHRQAVNTLACRKEAYKMTSATIALQLFSYAFDGFVTSFFTPLISGARVVLLSKQSMEDISKIIAAIKINKVTHFISVPVLYQALLAMITEKEVSSLKVVTLAGDMVSPSILEETVRKNKALEVVNEYGVTEVAVMSTIYRHQQRDPRVKIGHPIWNTSIFIAKSNNHLQLMPIGVFGEMYISGAGVSRGYMNNPELASERFLYSSHNSHLSHMSHMSHMSYIYKTGDLARWLPDGNIEFIGRKDHQVKIRGFRIEIGEIELQLLKHTDIKEAVVITNENGSDKYLCAYIVPKRELLTSQLREYLMNFLPDYMIPAYFIPLESLPLLPSGKIDRKLLPPPELAAITEKYIGPTNEIERQLAEIWAHVLNIEKESISINANFFELGGHSLKATILTNKIHKKLNVKIPMMEIFKSPTIIGMTEYIKDNSEDIFTSIKASEKKDYYELSSSQNRLYILQQLDTDATAYNVSIALELEGNPDKKKLKETFWNLLRRHESLRTSFIMIKQNPVQKIHQLSDIEFHIEYNQLEKENPENKIKEKYKAFIRPFDLSQAPLIRVGLVKVEPLRHVLIVDMHHIITDGVSHKILIEDFKLLYVGSQLSPLKLQYKDYSQWQQSSSIEKALQQQKEFWLGEFEEEIPTLDIPIDYPRPTLQSFEGRILGWELGTRETTALNELAKSHEVTLFMVLLAIFYIFLSKICNQEDIVVGTPVAGRGHADLEQIIGIFINMLSLRNYPRAENTFPNFLTSLKQRTLAVFDNQNYPFEYLVEDIVVERDLSRNPLFSVVFEMQNIFEAADIIPESNIEGLVIKPYGSQRDASQFDFSMLALEAADNKLKFNFEYCTRLFKGTTIERFIQYFKKTITSVLENPAGEIARIEIISKEEKRKILFDFNDTNRSLVKDKSYLQQLGEQVRKSPDKVAAQFNHQYVTYDQLNQEANRIAHFLSQQGVTTHSIVALYLTRSLAVLISIIGVFKAGAAYLPLETDYPESRIEYILENSQTKIIISETEHIETLHRIQPSLAGLRDILLLNREETVEKILSSYPTTTPKANIEPDDLAYMIYTSGTTGNPKGVLIHHLGMINHLYAKINDLSLFPGDTIAQTASACFDISVWQFLAGLLVGAAIYIIDKETILESREFLRVLQQVGVSILESVPSLMTALLKATAQADNRTLSLRWMISTGEPLEEPLVREWFHHYPYIPLLNAYGPTEASDDITHYIIKEFPMETTTVIPIGKPVQNLHIYILDKNLSLCPVGIRGEICTAGMGVGKGYWKDEQKTKKSFIPNPFIKDIKGTHYTTLYKTGDIGYFRDDGTVVCLGRCDDQVKIRGNRIQLEEIQRQLLSHEEIKEAVVIDRGEGADKYLCAYIAVGTNKDESDGIQPSNIDIEQLKKYLSRSLPPYMVPSYFVQMERLPLTSNGKIDKKALPAPGINTTEIYSAPRNKVERKLAEIWSQVLFPVDRLDTPPGTAHQLIGIDDNFFQLGGHSLKATIMVARIHKELGVKIPLAVLFRNPTIKELSRHIKDSIIHKYNSIQPTEKREFYDVSYSQRQLWILQQFEENLTAYNMFFSYVFENLHTESFTRAFQAIIKRHDSLRTTFINLNGEPKQKINSYELPGFKVEYINLEQEENWQEQIRKLSNEEFNTTFNLEKGPLMRAKLLHTPVNRFIFFVTMHHIVSDDWTMQVLINETKHLYDAYNSGEDNPLPSLKIQYKDFSTWQNSQLVGEKLKIYQDYWWNKFRGEIPVLNLETDYPRPPQKTFNGNYVNFQLEKQTKEGLELTSRTNNATILMILTASITALLYKYTGQEDIIIGLPVSGRDHMDLQDQVGFYVNILALRVIFSKNVSFETFLHQVRDIVLESFEHQVYPFDRLVNELDFVRDMSRSPLFDIVVQFFNLEGTKEKNNTEGLKGISTGFQNIDRISSKYDLVFNFVQDEENINGMLIYNTDLFEKESVLLMIEKMKLLLQEIVSTPYTPLDELNIETAIEKEMRRNRNFSAFDFE